MTLLDAYKRKRDFEATPEPAGKVGAKSGRSYCIQKHRASRLHYDFRLELDGVLKSWAVPKGPSLDPAAKRLAMHVEDHPVEYGTFEGTIPQGEYGGGTVMLWDRGEWEPNGDPVKGYRDGRLKFRLHGEKLTGGWLLVRSGGRQAKEERRWLLIKERDDSAKPSADGDLLDELPLSVSTGRNLDEIAAGAQSFPRVREDKPVDKATGEPPMKPAKRKAKKALASDYDAKKQTLAGVRLTSPDKILYPDAGITKLDLANYYRSVAGAMLPHLAGRPLVLVRSPDGNLKDAFFQKHPGPGTPDALARISIQQKNALEEYVLVKDEAGLISLAQIGALEIHAWGSRGDRLDYPDRLVFDLDPDPGVPWKRVVECGRRVREFLGELGLESFAKLTGGKGFHLVVPIDRRHDWDTAKGFCKNVADAIVAADPRNCTVNMAKAARSGKIFLDYLRNDRGATAIVPFSPRARAGAPVAIPIAWSELSARITPEHYTIPTLAKRLASLKGDPWEGFGAVKQRLTAPSKVLDSLSRSKTGGGV
jgi:bifunctional non-homologous end joining protein LigD